MVIVRQARESDRERIVDLIMEGFDVDFKPFYLLFSREAAKQLFVSAIQLDLFFVAEKEGKVVASLSITQDGRRPLSGSKKVASHQFNWLRARIAHLGLEEFEESLPCDNTVGYIELVAVDENFRRQNIASSLLTQAMEKSPHPSFMLDVKDNNTSARNCYVKLGFEEVGRKPAGFNFEKGFKEKLFMSRKRPVGSGRMTHS